MRPGVCLVGNNYITASDQTNDHGIVFISKHQPGLSILTRQGPPHFILGLRTVTCLALESSDIPFRRTLGQESKYFNWSD